MSNNNKHLNKILSILVFQAYFKVEIVEYFKTIKNKVFGMLISLKTKGRSLWKIGFGNTI